LRALDNAAQPGAPACEQADDVQMKLTNDDVQEIIRLLDATAYDELQIETDEFRLLLRRTGGGWTREQSVVSAPKPDAAAPAEAPATRPASAPPADAGGVTVRAPLPGTFYRAPQPGAPPFVEVGSRVEVETVVGIIESMKLMNPVPAGVAGEVLAICVRDAEPAETGAVLMRIRPTPS
jgi:acetyl-CoA carboxylase biotin carboxyl carrier protein